MTVSPNGIKARRLQDPSEDGRNAWRELKLTYDFSVHGGTAGTINLGVDPQIYNPTVNNSGTPDSGSKPPTTGERASDFTLPKNAIVREAFYDVETALVGSGASIALTTGESAGDLLAATAITSSGTLGLHDCIPVNTAATSKKMTAERNPAIVISAANLTAGKLVLHIRYVVSF